MSIRDTLITGEQARDIRRRAEGERQHFARITGGKRNYLTAEEVATRTAAETVTNEEKGRLEQYEIWRDPPERLFCYIRPDTEGKTGHGSAGIVATVWTGLPLGYGSQGPEWRDNFGGRRRSVRVTIAGHVYSGTAFVSSGDYARPRRIRFPH